MITLFGVRHYGKQNGMYKFGRETGQTVGMILGESAIKRSKMTWSYMYLEFAENAPIVVKGKAALVGVSDAMLGRLEDQWRGMHTNIDIYRMQRGVWYDPPTKYHNYQPAQVDHTRTLQRMFKPYELDSAKSFLNITSEPQIIQQTAQDEAVIRMANLIRSQFSESQRAQLVALLSEKVAQ